MGKAACSSKFQFPDFLGAFENAKDQIVRQVASDVQFQVGMRFDNEGAYNGHPHWVALKFRQGQILSLNGKLRKSIAPPNGKGEAGAEGFVRQSGSVSDFLVEVGSKIIYASVHDRGAVIKPKTKRALHFPIGNGKFAFAKSVNIPARPYTDLNAEDEQIFAESLAGFVASLMGGAQ